MSTSQKTASAWAPLRVGIFRALWLAVLVSNIGTWMQTVGAQWLLVHQPHASLLVALVQTAETLPAVLFAYVGGILLLAADFPRRTGYTEWCWTRLAAGPRCSEGLGQGERLQTLPV